MASGNNLENSEVTTSWKYAANVPPYTFTNRVLPPYLSPRDFQDVGLGDMPDGALRSTPEQRVQMAREIRRAALDALFLEIHGQDTRTWEKCKRTFRRRMGDDGDAWIDDTIELILREKELKDPIDTAEPQYADRATFHVAEQFFAQLNGTVWLETASDDYAVPTQEKVDAVQKHRDSLVVPVEVEIRALQSMLFVSCRTSESGRPPSYGDYDAKAMRVKQKWQDVERGWDAGYPYRSSSPLRT